ncbi:MAG: SpoIID/LytB protein [Clostridiales bacterium]|nr:SpoIID/LytB protein [Clostridiales bacterium]
MRRNRRRKIRYLKYFFIYLALLTIIAGIIYFLFFIPRNIKSGIVLDRKETSESTSLKLGYGKNIKWIKVKKSLQLPESIAYNVSLKGSRIQSITPCSVYSGKIFTKDDETVVLEDGKTLKLSPGLPYVKIENETLLTMPSNSVITGASDYKFIGDSDGNINLVIVNSIDIDSIRVGISNYDFSSRDHSILTFSSARGIKIRFNDKDYQTKRNEQLKVEYRDNTIELSIYTINKKENTFKATLGQSKNKIYVYPGSEEYPMVISSLKRTNGYVPQYYGSFEIFIRDNSLNAINTIDLEQYLRYVVPGEMLSSGGLVGYKVQAVAARTYVLSDMLAGRFTGIGFHVDDTTMSQVYNSLPAIELCDQAIEETKGLVMTHGGKIIDAKYYSTSSGVGAPFNQIYYEDNGYKETNPEPYLTFKDYTGTGIDDLSDETKATEFFKNWTIESYDSNSPYFRWMITIDGNLLEETINSSIYDRYIKSPKSFKKKWYLGIYRSTIIPQEGIGNIQDLYISKRGIAGNILEMTIVSDIGTYRVEREQNIKKLLTPGEFTITPIYGKEVKNFKAFPSPFFIIDRQLQRSSLKSITIYGGGFGHGVGMSQYGVIGLARAGKSYTEILDVFYENIRIRDYEEVIKTSI